MIAHDMRQRGDVWLRPFAHRGLHDKMRPENSLAGFRAAIAHGYGIEFDIQPASDGTPMVFHDVSLKRMTGHDVPIRTMTPAQLAGLRLQGTDAAIPTLAETLAEIGGRVPLLIEMKHQSDTLGPGHDALAKTIMQALDGYGGPVALMSFNPSLVREAASLRPDIPVGLISCGFAPFSWPGISRKTLTRLRQLLDFDPGTMSFISHDHRDLANPAIAPLRAQGVMVQTWTIQSAAAARAAMLAGADAITFEGFLP